MKKYILFLILSLFSMTIYSQESDKWKISAKSFSRDLMIDIDSVELSNSVSFQMHRQNNLKRIFSDLLIKYFRSKNDTINDDFNIAKKSLFHFFDLGGINISSNKTSMELYLIKFNYLSDTSDFIYIVYDRFNEEIRLFKANSNMRANLELGILHNQKYQEQILSKLYNYQNKANKETLLNAYSFLVPFTNNTILSIIYYYKDSDMKILTLDVKNNIIYW